MVRQASLVPSSIRGWENVRGWRYVVTLSFEQIVVSQESECPNCGRDISDGGSAQEGAAVYCIPCWNEEQYLRYGIPRGAEPLNPNPTKANKGGVL